MGCCLAGFIGLVSFAVVKVGFAKQLSKRIFTSATESHEEWEEESRCAEGELGEIIEDMHMTIFGALLQQKPTLDNTRQIRRC